MDLPTPDPSMMGGRLEIGSEGGMFVPQLSDGEGVPVPGPPGILAQTSAYNRVLEDVKTIFDLMGLVPGLGEPFDAASGVLSLMMGDTTGAMLSAAAMFPLGGQAATLGKLLRSNMIKELGEVAAQSKHAHHMLPQQFRKEFTSLGLDIDNSRFGVFMDPSDHVKLHGLYKYNSEWDSFFRNNANATSTQVLEELERLRKLYGF
jgi:hypothetical protein